MITKDQYAGAMKWAAVSLGSQTLVNALAVQIPICGVPPFKQILNSIFSTFLKVLANDVEFGMFFVYTDFRVTPQGKALFDAAMKNYLVRDTGTEKEKADAKEDLRAKFRTFAKLTA